MVNELQKVEYDQPIELRFISTLEKTLTPSKQYIKALSEYEKDHKEWEVDFKMVMRLRMQNHNDQNQAMMD